MLRRSRVLVVTLAVLPLLLAACGGGATTTTTTAPAATTTTAAPTTTTTAAPTTTTTAAPQTLTIWADEKRVPPLEAIAPAFEEATGVTVDVQLVPFGDIRDKVSQAGPTGEGPDIFVGAHDWTGELAANGVIDPIDVSAIADSFVPVALQGFNFEGQNYAIPYVTEAIAMYRNTDMVPDAPATFDDLAAACEAASAPNCVVIPGGGTAADAYHNYPFVSAFGGYIFQYGSDTGFDASVVGLDTPEAIEGVQYLQDQVDAGVIPSTDYDTAKNLFLEGQAAFWITGPWELATILDQTDVNWDVSLIPPIGDRPTQPFVGAQGFFLSHFSENKLIATSFLLDYVSTDEVMQALYDADPRGTAWVAVQDTLGSDPNVQVFDASAANGIPMPNIPEMSAVWGPLGDDLLNVRNGEMDAADAMQTAAEAVRTAVSGG
jgi:arabinogalactan oligomer/maltooligosaccharide transport system substrate-binding protein